jgi:hypothetical protein
MRGICGWRCAYRPLMQHHRTQATCKSLLSSVAQHQAAQRTQADKKERADPAICPLTRQCAGGGAGRLSVGGISLCNGCAGFVK